MGPCAKQRVVAMAVLGDGTAIFGENICLTPQTSCPRVPGEAYAKCITECSQLGHAEEVVLRQIRMAGYLPSDVRSLHVYGHTGPCDNCHNLLRDVDLLAVTEFHPNDVLPAFTENDRKRITEAYNLERPSSHSSSSK
jgi:hypothetical protein